MLPGTSNEQGDVVHSQEKNSSANGAPLGLQIKQEKSDSVDMVSEDANGSEIPGDVEMEVDGSEAATFAPTNGSQEPHDVPKRKLEEGDTDQDSKKSKLNEYSNDAVIEYVNKAKEKHLEMFLDHLMELFFLEHSGNFMEFLIWKKKPPTDTLRQYITVNADQELADLLASKVLVESTHQSAKTPSLPQPVENISNLTPSLSSSIQTTPVIGSSSRSTFTPSEPPVISDTPETGPVSAKIPATVPRAQLISRTSAKNACSALISSSGAAAYAGRPHATRQHSISAVYESSIGSQEQIVERAKQEAHVVQRIAELRKEGLWSLKRLPKVQEPPRAKAHWDYLLEEMSWLATDFAQERKWKKTAAKKCARMVMKYHQDKQAQKEKERREQHAKLRKIASTLAKEIKGFWANVEKVLDFKQRTKLEEKRKKALDMHLNFIVGQTEQYSSWLAEGLANTKSNAPSIDDAATEVGTVDSSQPLEEPQTSDNDFEPAKLEETDDEETIAKEEAEASDVSDHGELDLLQKESEMPIEELLKTLPGAILSTPASISSSHPPSVDEAHSSKKDDDEEFEGIDEEDDEETIEREEKEEASADYADELKELDDENNLTVEQLMEKYKGAYDEGFDLPVISDDETVVDDEDEMEVDDVDDNETEEDTESEEESEKEEIGMEFLIHPETESAKKALSEEVLADVPHPSLEITDIAAGAEQIQPKGNTLSTAKVVTKVPFLLKYTLREYQHIGLDWLVAMYDKKLNGILADEMGLGKTIQTIALLAHLACEKGIWGPHLIVVPTSVMLNWEMEIKKWCPAFKTLTYYGTPKERKAKRQGWTKPNQFHICITSYKLVVQDHQSFRRKKWRYLILDEAQHIKNFKSQRWQMLLNFNTSRRLLLTGTPLQNNLMELWSLMHFLMPSVFASHKDFKDWFVNPVTGMIEGNHEFNEALIRRLHKVLRPFLLRRLKSQVEQQMPKKYEHVVLCRLSKRQRFLYEEFMSLTKTKETLASGNFLSVINVLMQLRKVCNHPNLFETRPTVSPFAMEGLTYETASLATKPLLYNPLEHINLDALGLNISQSSLNVSAFVSHRVKKFQTPSKLIEEIDSMPDPPPPIPKGKIRLQFRTSKSQAPLSPGRATRSNLPLKSSNQGVGSSPATRHIVLVTSSVKTNGKETNSLISKSSGTSLMKKVADDVSSVKPNKTNSQKEKDTPLVEPVEEEPMDIDDTTLELGKEINQKFILPDLVSKTEHERAEKLRRLGRLNSRRCSIAPFYPSDLIEQCTVCQAASDISSNCPERSDFSIGQGYYHCLHAKSDERNSKNYWSTSRTLNEAISTPIERMNSLKGHMNRFVTAVSPVAAPSIQMHVSHPEPSKKRTEQLFEHDIRSEFSPKCDILHPYISNIRTQFPELRLIQYDCGKLQTLDTLLWKLKSGGHRALIFTQMSRMLDIFEQFLSYHGHTYLRLDGATKIEMRQSLMERFNADKKIFCFILSTRSGGVGVNLTGADTVIFYDSDWNPTMDAQAQDRCHRIGQTRDVHIYRLISERTIEENILKKAQQKRLLGDVAIEEGNFTTAFFKQNAITDLFGDGLKGMGDDLSSLLDDPVVSVSTTQLSEASVSEDPNLRSKWEEALEDVEENTDIAAAKTARAEAAAEYAEFDETIPLDQEAPGDEKSPAEEELDQLVNELTPVERYALQYLEANQDPATTEQLKLAEEEIEAQKKDWEFERLQALKKEAERGSEESDSDKDDIVTMSRQDAYNQMYISSHHMEQMPMWAPPTPPQDDTDFYVDHSVGFMYESTAMPESQLPPVYVQKENKRLRVEPSVVAARKQQKMRKEELLVVPKSLFDRPSPVVIKLRKEVKVQKARGNLSGGPDVAQLQKILSVLAPNVQLPTPPTLVAQFQNSKTSHILLAGLQHENTAPWTINEEFSIMQALQLIQELPANLLVLSPGHLPNWDLVSDLVSSMSPNFRAPRVCRHHYETAVIPREEGKVLSTEPPPKKKKQMKNQPPTTAAPPLPPTTPTVPGAPVATPAPKGRPVKTSYLFKQDDHHQFSQLSNTRFETLKSISIKKAPSMKPIFMSGTNKNNPKHIALLHDNGIQYEAPLTPQSIADLRQKRIVSEKAKQNEQANRQKQMQLMQARQQQAQVRGPAPVPQQQLMNALQQQQPQQFAAMQARAMQAMGQQVATSGATMTRGPTPPSAGSSLASSTASQEVAHIAKALSQAAATFTAQAAAGPQSLQANVQVGARVAVSSAGTIVGTTAQLISGGNVVSVSNLPQNQQKLIITSVPAGQAGPKYTPQQLQAYKQRQLLQQQQPKMQQAQILANVGQTIQSQGSQGQGNQVLLSTAGGSIAGRVTVSGAGSGQLVPVSAGTVSVSGAGNVVSMSALPSTQQKLIITALPAGQGGHKLTAQQLQQYTKTLQFQQAKAQQAQLLQSNSQNIQSQVSHANQVQLNPSIVGLSTGRVTVTTTSAGVGQLVSNAGSSQGIVVSAASLQNQAKLITVPAGQVAPKLTQQQLQQILQQPKMQQAQILTTSGAQSIQSQNQITAQMQIQQIAQQLQSSGQQGRIQIVATSVASSSMNQAGQQQTKLITVPAGQPQKLTLHQAQLLASGGSQSIQPQTSTTQIQLQSVPAQTVQGRVQLVTTVPSTQASVPGQGQQGTSGGQGQSLIATGVKQQQVATNAIVSSALLVSVPGMGQRVLTAAPQAGQQIIRRVTEAEIAQLLKQQQQQNQPK